MHSEKVGAVRGNQTEKVFRKNTELKKYSELIKLKKGGLYCDTYPYCFDIEVTPLGEYFLPTSKQIQ